MYRAPTARHARVAGAFIDWGIPTADSIRYCRQAAPSLPIIASGGIRDGIDVAKCIALGASVVGFAGAFLKAADQAGVSGVIDMAETVTEELKVTMFAAAAKDQSVLSQTKLHRRS
jgi:isopentenyl-diphosphate delta-isomerase